ncbi:MAG: hypothetical protein J5534_09810 [Fibrobacter sp.]|nr:hypothetical protein [Fibrobacter sp.]
MKEFSIPFNTYDFFGYLLPGTLFSLGLAGIFHSDALKVYKKFEGMSSFLAVISTLIVCACLYFLGQIIGCIGHIIYDRIIVRNILGYPFYKILGMNSGLKYSYKNFSFFFVLLFFAVIIFPVFYYASDVIPGNKIKMIESYYMDCIVFRFILALFVFVSLKKIFVFFKEKMDQFDLKKILNINDGDGFLCVIFNVVESLFFIIPANLLCRMFVYVFRKITATDYDINDCLKKRFLEKLEDRTELKKEDFEKYGSDIYWVTYIDLMKVKNPCHQGKISNWLDMYGCLRNYSCVFLLLAVIESFRLWFNVTNGKVNALDFFILLGSLILSFLLFLRYWIMYYSYYSKYIIRAYALEEHPSDSQKNLNKN